MEMAKESINLYGKLKKEFRKELLFYISVTIDFLAQRLNYIHHTQINRLL